MPPEITVVIEKGDSPRSEYTFTDSFSIGREDTCDIHIPDGIVSRKHLEVYFERGRWWVEDDHSANGTYVGGERIDRVSVSGKCTVELGSNGPRLSFYSESVADSRQRDSRSDISVDQVMDKYFRADGDHGAGQHTMMVRRAFQHVQKKQKKKYIYVISLVAVLLMITGVYAVYQHRKIQEQKQIARDLFYRLKELEIAQARLPVENPEGQKELLNLKAEYDDFMDQLGVYDQDMDREERLILHVARVFGECDVDLPSGFVGEVKKYIQKWKSTGRYQRGINRARANRYIEQIVREFEGQGLPPQFFYIALQESGFRIDACGPPTRFGYAKGMWQFIPGTARDYGLRVGPLFKDRVPDPQDERHNFEKATNAAARYIKFIYNTDAQASGLLVMASYNWGERKIADLIKQMPENPRDRNFWKLLEDHVDRFPQETYDYVFYIFSAAVIGEDPRHFGFEFDNPLSVAATNSP
jgi:hypothetical protein